MTDDRHLLRDINLELRHRELRPVYKLAETTRHVTRSPQGGGYLRDWKTVNGRENLAQAVIMRLLTPRGELTELGHPEYGSRLHELIGRVNTETTHNLVKLHILESLAREPRVAETSAVTVIPHPHLPTRVDVALEVVPVGATDTVTIGPFSLRLTP